MVIKKKNNSVLSRDKPINNVDSENKNSNSIGFVKYHPDRNLVLYCYPNSKSVFYGESVDGKNFELLEHGSHNDTITSIDIGSKNKCATASKSENRVLIFGCNSKNDITEIKTLSNPTSIQFNSTQSYLAVGLSSGQIKYYLVANINQAITVNNAHDGDIVCLSFSSDGDYLASIGNDNKLNIWSTDSFEHDKPSPIHSIDIDSSLEVLPKIGISWRSNQKELTIPTRSGLIKSFIFDGNDMENEYKSYEFGSEGHTKETTSVAWDHEGKYLASVGLDSNLFIWNSNSDESISEDPIYSYKHSNPINSFSWRSQPSQNSISFIDKSRLNIIQEFLNLENTTNSQESNTVQDDVDDFNFDEFDPDQNQNEINSMIGEKKNLKKSIPKDESDQEMNNSQDEEDEDQDNQYNETNENNEDNEDNESVYSQQNRIYDNCQQEAFQIGSTLLNVLNNPKSSSLKTKRYFMAYNMLGKIIKREESVSGSEASSIEVEFHETGYHKKITFSDKNHNLRLASLGPNGAIFATKYLPNEKEEYEQKQEELIEKQKNSDEKGIGSQIKPLESVIMFKPFDTLADNSEWTLVDTEEVAGVAITKNYVVSVSSNKTLRLFSLGGIQLNIFTIPGDLVTMNAFEDTLAIVYHRSNALNDNQSMNVWWINLANGKQIYHDHLSISTNSTLLWIGFSDNGLLTTMDSLGIVRQLSNGWFTCSPSTSSFLQWTIIMDLRKCEKSHSMDLYTYWIIGLNKTDLYSIFCSGYPIPPKCTHNYVKIETPLLSNVDAPVLNIERDYLKNKFNISNLVNQNQNNLNSSCIISSEEPINESLITKHLTDLDSATLRLFHHFTKLGRYQKAIDLCKTLNIKKSLQIAFTFSNEQRLPWLSKKIVELIETFKPFKLDNNNNNNSNNNNNTASSNSTSKTNPKDQNENIVVDSPPKTKASQKPQSDNEYDSESETESKPIANTPPKSKSNNKSVKKAPFLIKKDNQDSKKRKETQSSNQPSKISKFQ